MPIARRLRRWCLGGWLAAALGLAAGAVAAQDCARLEWVTHHGVTVNARHIFCGELKRGKPKGFHSLALADSAGEHLVRLPLHKVRPQKNGIYDAQVDFSNGARKFSTFFPDACNYQQVLASVAYAAAHQSGKARPWGVLGASAPEPAASGYCLDSRATPFSIRIGLIDSGRRAGWVNTAFPE